jgi:hypothetical protein
MAGNQGHLEQQDALLPRKIPDGFAKGLRRIYQQEFAPIAATLTGTQAVRVSKAWARGGINWSGFTDDQSPKAIFSIPEGIDTVHPHAAIMARLITEVWSPGPVTKGLRPVLLSLIKLGQRSPAKETLEEDVSESVYVMF